MPLHQDNNLQGTWFNFLTTIREYKSGSTLQLNNIDTELRYDSGMMVALLGKVIRYRTSEVDGNCICITQYMRDNVEERREQWLRKQELIDFGGLSEKWGTIYTVWQCAQTICQTYK